MADFISKVTLPDNNGYPIRASAIPYGEVDSTSTSTAFTATVPGIYELKDGVCIYLRNNVVTSAANFTININNLGAKPVYNNLEDATRQTTLFNEKYTMLFIYNENRVEDGCWDLYRGYDSNTNTIGYQLRTNSGTLPASDKGYRYRIWFTSLDGKKLVPANTSTATDANTEKTPNTRVIDPFGPIVYYSVNGTTQANANLTATGLWQQYIFALGYSFNTTGAALTLTHFAPVYVQCTPQETGGAILNGYTQTLPTNKDGKIYIFLGIAYNNTNIELRAEHPVYYHDGNGIKLWNGYNITDLLPSPLSSFHTTVGDGTTTSFTINHYLNTKNILVSVNITDNNITYIAPLTSLAALNQIGYAVTINSNDSIVISFTSAPASNAAEISIISAIAYSSASDENLLRIS